jgi:hypothetical protein
MISSVISRVSALVLAVAGLPLLFASDLLLPQLLPGFPPNAAWVGQLIAAGWLSIALYNWNSRDTLLGGIYGRPAVNLNLVMYTISALALVKAGSTRAAGLSLAVPFSAMAIVYGSAMLRGPFDKAKG